MIYENDIPDFAMQPAKEPVKDLAIEPEVVVAEVETIETKEESDMTEIAFVEEDVISFAQDENVEEEEPVLEAASGVYAPLKLNSLIDSKEIVINVEEDILVPDIKMDMKEILLMDGTVRIVNTENGEISLQTIYIPDSPCDEKVVSIDTKIPFKTQLELDEKEENILVLQGLVQNIEHMIINERKFRIKATVELQVRQYGTKQIDIFEKLINDDIETLKEKNYFTDVCLRKKDVLTIEDFLYLKDNQGNPRKILKHCISVVENYKQITGEKIVINGFIYCNILYCGESLVDEGDMNLFQYQGRVEFTEFIPVNQSGPWSGSRVSFDSSCLKLDIDKDEEGKVGFKITGDLETSIELYKTIEKEIVVDGYHKEREFCCDFEEESFFNISDNLMSETSIREIIGMPEHISGIEKVVCCFANIKSADAKIEKGKCIITGELSCKILCQAEGDSGLLFTIKETLPYRSVSDINNMAKICKINREVYIKDLWADKINKKQIEFNCSLVIFAELIQCEEIKTLRTPRFCVEKNKKKTPSMAISVVQDNDTLWTVAKRFKTSIDNITQLNDVSKGIEKGQKLLIIK